MTRFLVFAVLLLAGCAAPPRVEMANPSVISVSYEASEGPSAAYATAQGWCGQTGKNAVPTTKSGMGNQWSYRFTQNFECR